MGRTIALAAIIVGLVFTAPARPATPALGYHGCVACWDRVASCESGGRWNINTSNGYLGGLQWLLSTWLANGGGRYASLPQYATRMQQITVASRMPLSHWPTCGRRYYG